MKNRILIGILCCFLVISLSVTVGAADMLVIDNAGVMTDEEIVDLEYMARDLRDTYGMDVVILTVYGLEGKTTREYADDYFDYNGFSDDGMLLLIDLETRDGWLSTEGTAVEALTDYGIESLLSTVASYMQEDDYYGGFHAFLEALPFYLDAYVNGEPIDLLVGEKESSFSFVDGVICVIVALSAGAVTVGVMRSHMDTKNQKRSAADYLDKDTYDLRREQDMFLYSEVHKSAKPKDSDSGGSSTHESSSGDSHGGGGFSF